MWRGNGRQSETRGDKTSDTPPNTGTHVTMEDNGRQWKQWETMGDNGGQWETMGDNGRQEATRGDKASRRRTHHPTQAHTWGDKGRQGLGKAETPSNTGPNMGKQWETRGDTPLKGAHTWRQGETRPEKADTPSNKGTHVGPPWETRPREGGQTIQHRHTHGETMGDNGRQGGTWLWEGAHAHHPQGDGWREGETNLEKADTPSTEAHMWGDNGKADTPSNKGQQEGVQWETRPSGIQARETRREGRRTIQQRKQEGVPWETRGEQDPREGGRTIQHQGRHLRKALRTPNSTLFGEIYPHQMVGCISPL